MAHELIPESLQPLGRSDCVRECDRPPQPETVAVPRGAILRVLKGPPAPHDLRRVSDVDFAVAGLEMPLDRAVDALLGHREYHDLVIRQQVLFDRPRERQPIELRPIRVQVVHRKHFDRVVRCLRLRGFRVQPRSSGHVEPLPCSNSLGVMDQDERGRLVFGAINASRPMRLVAQH